MPRDEIVRFYENEYSELDRLSKSSHGRLEYLRTTRIIGGHLDSRPMNIADIGGGPGAYASWLAGLGHDVELVDPVAGHVEQARASQAGSGSIRASVGDALDLELDDESVDAILLLGPLYHLPEAAERGWALAECHRILRPGGLMFAAAISRFASFHDGLSSGSLRDPAFAAIVNTDLQTGFHQNPTGRPGWFTEAYFHRPDELRSEIVAAKFQDVSVHGVEGLAGWLPDLGARLDDPQECGVILDGLDRVSTEPSILGVSAHLLAIGTKASGTC